MKKILRILLMLLVLCIITLSSSSCLAYIRVMDALIEMEEESLRQEAGKHPDSDPDADGGNPYLRFSLTEEDQTRFYELLENCEKLTMEGTDATAIDRAWEDLESHYYHIGTQANIARILYDYNSESDRYAEDYLFASEMLATVYESYMELCQQIDQSQSPYREEFFSDWTEMQLEEMRSYTEEITRLKLEADEIMIEARELDVTKEGAAYNKLYRRFVETNTKIAKAMGKSNYYVYASQNIYMRDYGSNERNNLRYYVKNFLVPLCATALERFVESMDSLTYSKQQMVEAFLYDNYKTLSKDYVAAYLDALDESMASDMREMFDKNNSIFTDSDTAYDGAYTAYLHEYGRSVCYFGPNYQNAGTVIHEMGHFYAAQFTPDEEISLDIAEIQSQGNEMLFLAYLKGEMGSIYHAVKYYQIYSMLSTIIVATIVDEFEETVYVKAANQGSGALDFEEILDAVESTYGGEGFVQDCITDMGEYWKYVAIESPVYYISYATSGVTSLSLYVSAMQDFDSACGSYRALSENLDEDAGFEKNLFMADLSSPFKRETYEVLRTELW